MVARVIARDAPGGGAGVVDFASAGSQADLEAVEVQWKALTGSNPTKERTGHERERNRLGHLPHTSQGNTSKAPPNSTVPRGSASAPVIAPTRCRSQRVVVDHPPPGTPLPATPATGPQRPRRPVAGTGRRGGTHAALASWRADAAVRAADDGTGSPAPPRRPPQEPGLGHPGSSATPGSTATTVRQADLNNPNWTTTRPVTQRWSPSASRKSRGGSARDRASSSPPAHPHQQPRRLRRRGREHLRSPSRTVDLQSLGSGDRFRGGSRRHHDDRIRPKICGPIAWATPRSSWAGPVVAVGNPSAPPAPSPPGSSAPQPARPDLRVGLRAATVGRETFGFPLRQQGGSTNQTPPVVTNAIQTSAAINPGRAPAAPRQRQRPVDRHQLLDRQHRQFGREYRYPDSRSPSTGGQVHRQPAHRHGPGDACLPRVTLGDGQASDGKVSRAGALVTGFLPAPGAGRQLGGQRTSSWRSTASPSSRPPP